MSILRLLSALALGLASLGAPSSAMAQSPAGWNAFVEQFREYVHADSIIGASALRIVFAALLWMQTLTFGSFAQEAEIHPAGNWQSARSATYTNPSMTGAEIYLDITIATDGSFSGSWGQYSCTSYPAALGLYYYSCSGTAANGTATGRFEPRGRGLIVLGSTGQSTFEWKATSNDGITITLPRKWLQSEKDILYQARLTRDGRAVPEVPAATTAEGPLLSAVALYREFDENPDAALARYGGRPLILEGLRGALIPLDGGGAAVHIPDGFNPRALVLDFSDPEQLNGIAQDVKFKFQCTVDSFAYLILWMEKCSVVRE